MTGSKRWFRYQADNGSAYAVELDEGNSEATVNGSPLLGNLYGAEGLLPKRLRMRYLNAYNTSNPTQRRRFWVGSQAVLGAVFPGTQVTVDGVTWAVTSTRGEKSTVPSYVDTGQIDGDTPN